MLIHQHLHINNYLGHKYHHDLISVKIQLFFTISYYLRQSVEYTKTFYNLEKKQMLCVCVFSYELFAKLDKDMNGLKQNLNESSSRRKKKFCTN